VLFYRNLTQMRGSVISEIIDYDQKKRQQGCRTPKRRNNSQTKSNIHS